jgi:hypothetical protein
LEALNLSREKLVSSLCFQMGQLVPLQLGMLFGWSDDWTKSEAIVYVTVAQALCGVVGRRTSVEVELI